MSSFLKGKFLEYSLRQIMFRCGFSTVMPDPDRMFIWERSPLLFINGKGAAHDADVLVEPPIQMPFTYPSRILFECKAYSKDIGLPIIRNASGLRSDINDFEIVTEDFLLQRQNNIRANLAIHNRKRYWYQVGVASIFGFTKPAIEFAANNKIPLFSLEEAFRGSRLIELITAIPPNINEILGEELFTRLKECLSDKYMPLYRNNNFIRIFIDYPDITAIINELQNHISRVHVGVLENGELIFITKNTEFHPSESDEQDVLNNRKGQNIKTRIYWQEDDPNIWSLEFSNRPATSYSFYLPYSIAASWATYEEQKSGALDIKATQFSRIFVFGSQKDRSELPFNILTLDQPWLYDLRRQGRQSNNH